MTSLEYVGRDLRVGQLGEDSDVGRVFELSTDSHSKEVIWM
jgi:hypothetical protein